jgi:hypothetical protein
MFKGWLMFKGPLADVCTPVLTKLQQTSPAPLYPIWHLHVLAEVPHCHLHVLAKVHYCTYKIRKYACSCVRVSKIHGLERSICANLMQPVVDPPNPSIIPPRGITLYFRTPSHIAWERYAVCCDRAKNCDCDGSPSSSYTERHELHGPWFADLKL